MADSTLRQRSGKSGSTQSAAHSDEASSGVEDNGRAISVLDIIRVILTLIGASCVLSYYLTSGESALWGYKPWFIQPKALAYWWSGPLRLTPAQLALFNGSDATKPIFLAINGTIFDVSEGRHTYGPGGSYAVFAGRDATRAFVTGCFLEDRTSDLRGAEEIYIPIDDPEEEISSGERKKRAERERREAKKRVLREVQKWEDFYRNSKKYFEAGTLVGVEEHTGPPPPLCDAAQQGRPKRKRGSVDEAASRHAPGKPVT